MKKRPMFLWYIICAVILAAALLFGLYYRLVLRKVIAFTYAYPPMARIYIYLGNPALRFALAGLVGGFAADRIHLQMAGLAFAAVLYLHSGVYSRRCRCHSRCGSTEHYYVGQ